MGRISSQTNTKDGTSTKYDEEKNENIEREDIDCTENERRTKPEKGASRQKDRNNRNDKSGFDRQHKRFADKSERHYKRGNDYEHEGKSDAEPSRESTKPSTKTEENLQRGDAKFDQKSNWKNDRDVRNDPAQKSSAKHGRTQRGGGYKQEGYNSRDKEPAFGENEKQREKGGRNYSYEPAAPYQQNPPKNETDKFKDENTSKESLSKSAEAASTSAVPAKEKERSGKSYSSKRRERQQQRGERALDET